MVMCWGADLHMAQLMPLTLTILAPINPDWFLPFWCRLTLVILDKIQIQKGCKSVMCVCLCVSERCMFSY